jgi:hypothetical protein
VLNSTLWKLARHSWSRPRQSPPTPGYAALLPVPGDLPVFLKIALSTINNQANTGLVETLVIPDNLTPDFEAQYEAAKSDWKNGPLMLVKLSKLEQFLTKRLNSPHTNHWLQLINGIEASTATHALLHDADLFITDRTFLAGHYAAMVTRKLACLGVNPVWDTWYAQNGLDHVTATWELLFDIEWARSFAPWMHRGHHGEVRGRKHEFDTMLLPQCLTEPPRIGRRSGNFGFVHFNYVICTYRWFQQAEAKGKGPYTDEHWRILLIRLLVDAYQSSESAQAVPRLDELAKGLSGQSKRVDYRGETARKNYPEFRGKLEQLIESGVLSSPQIAVLREGVRPFDQAMHWEPAPLTSAVA